jgi:hypothetical protein
VGGAQHSWQAEKRVGKRKDNRGTAGFRAIPSDSEAGPAQAPPHIHHDGPCEVKRGNGALAEVRGHASCGKAPSHPHFCAPTLFPTPCGSERDACASGMTFLEPRPAKTYASMYHASGEGVGGSWEGSEGPGAATGRAGSEGQGIGAATHQTRSGAPPKPPVAPPCIAPVPMGPYGSWEASPQAVASCDPAWGPGARPFAAVRPESACKRKTCGEKGQRQQKRGTGAAVAAHPG